MGQGSRDVSLRTSASRFSVAVIFGLTIVGCATSPPAPIVDRATSGKVDGRDINDVPESDSAAVGVLEQKPPRAKKIHIPADVDPKNAATQQLLAAIDGDIERRDYDAATAGIERVLRINPGDAWAWHKLAQLHFVQDDHGQAKSIALRSNALPSATARVAAANWFLIADIERAAGDEAAAQAAYAKAESKLDDDSIVGGD